MSDTPATISAESSPVKEGTPPLLAPADRVLSTMNRDGSRRWLTPRPSRGWFWRARRAVAYILIAIFVAIPLIPINGRPAVLLDVVRREFTLFGKVFLPTDTLLMALLLMSVFIAIFLATALFGRVWCGWACPQTVYMEFLFRPIERLLEGEPGRARKLGSSGFRKALKFAIYAAISVGLAHVFLAYFVGWERLSQWVFGSPFQHLSGFLTVVIVSGLMLFDFGFFREQTCIVACPYGRFQSVLLDRKSTIVAYDRTRGEPRGKAAKAAKPAKPDVKLLVLPNPGVDMVTPGSATRVPERPSASLGDCVDCTLCVQTCPTGIDIREGLQMECINCTQCIDACDAVMTRLNRPTGLIRYASQEEIEGRTLSKFRPRLAIYPLALVAVLAAFITMLALSKTADVTFLRGRGLPYSTLPSGEIANTLRIKITNRTEAPQRYTIAIRGADGVRLEIAENPMVVAAGAIREEPMLVVGPASVFVAGRFDVTVSVSDGAEYNENLSYGLVGPVLRHGASK